MSCQLFTWEWLYNIRVIFYFVSLNFLNQWFCCHVLVVRCQHLGSRKAKKQSVFCVWMRNKKIEWKSRLHQSKKVDRGKQKLKQLCSHVLEIKSDGDDKHMGIDMKKIKHTLVLQNSTNIQLVWSDLKKLHPTKTKLIRNLKI